MNDNNFDDMTSSSERKSIKNIPLPTRKRAKAKKVVDELAESTPELDSAEEEIIDLRKVEIPTNEHVKVRKHKDSDESTHNDVEPDEIKINNPYQNIDEEEEEEIPPFNYKKSSKKSRNKNMSVGYYKFGAFIVVILIAVVAVMSIFKSASITVFSKTQKIQNTEIIIPIENTVQNSSDTILDYKEVSLESTAEVTTKSDKEEEVSEKASGIITVFNEYSNTPQKLIANTRFQTADGKVYRIQALLTVPGYTEKDGKIIAGSIDAKVVADEAGDKFNITQAEFKIPGFEGQEQYDKFYAKTKTQISGGFVGIKKIIEPETLEVTVKELETRLTTNLKELVKTQISEDFIVVNTTNNYTFASPEQKNSKGDNVTLSMKGFAKFLVISKKDLSKSAALNQNIDVQSDIMLTNLENIEVALIENEDSNLSLKLNGEFDFKWEIDEEMLKNDLAGTNKSRLGEITLKHLGIENISNVIVRPIWSSKFPGNPAKIKIIEMQ